MVRFLHPVSNRVSLGVPWKPLRDPLRVFKKEGVEAGGLPLHHFSCCLGCTGRGLAWRLSSMQTEAYATCYVCVQACSLPSRNLPVKEGIAVTCEEGWAP